MEQCSGKINSLGLCDKCGKASMSSSSYCQYRYIFTALPAVAPPHEDKGAGTKAYLVMLSNRDSVTVHGAFFDEDSAYKYLGQAKGFIHPIEIIGASQERSKAIQDCLDCFAPVFKIEPKPENTIQIIEAFRDGFRGMEKLKNK